MDQDIRDALTDLKNTVNSRFDQIDKRVDLLIPRGEFDATVAGLKEQHAALRREFDRHEGEAPAHRKAASDRAEAVRIEVRTDLDGFRATTRWAIGLSATGAGVVVALLSWVINIIK